MLLQRLVEYAHKTTLPPTGYDFVPIKWIIDLDAKCKADPSFVPMSETGKKNDKGMVRLAPFRERTSTAIRPKLLADNGEYTFGVAKDGMKGNRDTLAKKCNQDYLALLKVCVVETGDERIPVVLHYLENWRAEWLPADFTTDLNITFRINNELLIDSTVIREFWAKKFWQIALEDKEEDEDSEEEISLTQMECHICGKQCEPIARHPFKIKGIPKSHQKGNAIISADKSAFSSFGLKASLVAPTCSDCVESYAKAANNLLQREDAHITVGPFAYVFWTKEESSFSFATLLSKPDAAQVHQLIESAFSGKKAALEINASPFYAAALSASGARVAIRDWLETTVNHVKQNLARYFRLQRIAELDGSEPQPMGINTLSAATVPLKQNKPDYEKISPNVPKALLKCALEGKPLPEWLLYQAVKRTKAEQGVRKEHAAIIKMVLASQNKNFDEEGNGMEKLDKTNKEPAYLCGQLLGVLESVQYAAMGKTNSTVIGRFYGTASSAPASVFGTLLRGAQAHLDKLRKNPVKEGTYVALQRKLEDVQRDLTMFPKTLTLQQQGLFALGYYHLRAKDAKDRADAKAKKLANNTNESDTNE